MQREQAGRERGAQVRGARRGAFRSMVDASRIQEEKRNAAKHIGRPRS